LFPSCRQFLHTSSLVSFRTDVTHSPGPTHLRRYFQGYAYGWVYGQIRECCRSCFEAVCRGEDSSSFSPFPSPAHSSVLQTNFTTLVAVLLSLAFYLAWDIQGHPSGVSFAFAIIIPKLSLVSMLASVNSGQETSRSGLDSRAIKHGSVRLLPSPLLLSLLIRLCAAEPQRHVQGYTAQSNERRHCEQDRNACRDTHRQHVRSRRRDHAGSAGLASTSTSYSSTTSFSPVHLACGYGETSLTL
jgi:hypothetical protein